MYALGKKKINDKYSRNQEKKNSRVNLKKAEGRKLM